MAPCVCSSALDAGRERDYSAGAGNYRHGARALTEHPRTWASSRGRSCCGRQEGGMGPKRSRRRSRRNNQETRQQPLEPDVVRRRLGLVKEYLEAARLLFEHESYLSGVSRAYYAVLHACALCLDIHCPSEHGAIAAQHDTVLTTFIERFVKHRVATLHIRHVSCPSGQREVTQAITEIKAAREDADYWDGRGGPPIDRRRASRQVEFAEALAIVVSREVESCLQG